MDPNPNEQLRREWTDQYVLVDETRPELMRFKGIVGRVVTVSHNNRCLVDFQDGGWYDILPVYLKKIDAEEGKKKFDATMNSAQPLPARQS
jgi:hypothetical protein